ncbi:MAG: hypothetical protein E7104_00380 [Prevotella sp.]|nr:hypothetical protein [Prevotella sp.]
MKKILLLLIAAFALASCTHVDEAGTPESPKEKHVLHVKLSSQGSGSRAIDPTDEYAIHSCYIVTFDESGQMVGSGAIGFNQAQTAVDTEIEISTNYGERIKAYAVANTGNSTVFSHIETYNQFKDVVAKIQQPEDLGNGVVTVNGIELHNQGQLMVSQPMDDFVTVAADMEAVNLTLVNQCAALKFTIIPSSKEATGEEVLNPVKIVGYRLCHVPLSSYLLPDNMDLALAQNANAVVAPPQSAGYGDFAYEPINNTNRQVFTKYIFENVCGRGTSTSALERYGTGVAADGTYLEIEVECKGVHGTYRFYLGDVTNSSTSDPDYHAYNLYRHQDYNITININSVAIDDSRFTIRPEPQVGDYLFSDGSWGSYTAGTATAARHPIAVVFSSNPTRKDRNAGYIHGYAIALASAGTQLKWANEGAAKLTQLMSTPCTTLAEAKADLEGRTKSLAIAAQDKLENGGVDPTKTTTKYPSVYYAMHFGTSEIGLTTGTGSSSTEASGGSAGYAAPANTSGWFLGSIGQYYLVAKNLGGNIDTGTNNTWSEGGSKYWYISGSQANKTTLEGYFSAGSNTWAPSFGMPWASNSYETWYWTSSEFSAANGFVVSWDRNGNFNLNGNLAKSLSGTGNRGVRPVIAF